MSIYVINGRPESGKSTFCEMVREVMTDDYAEELSTVDFVKEIAYHCGWDGTKTLENRKFLSELKKLLTEWNDIPINHVKEEVKDFLDDFEYWHLSDAKKTAVFINCREPAEIKRLCEELDAKSILVIKPERVDCEVSNESDANVFDYDYDIVIQNDGSLYDLANKAVDFVTKQELHLPCYKDKLKIDLFGKISYN